MTQFTVILPTHDHVDTLWFSIESVLAQTVRDFELIVVGDGAPPRTAEIVAAIAERDPRVRYVSNPKGERHGELSRHAALQRRMSTPICLDESITSVERAEDMIQLGSGRIVNIKPGRVGGFAVSKRIHDVCANAGIEITHDATSAIDNES